MIGKNNTRYIITLFRVGVPFTLRHNGKLTYFIGNYDLAAYKQLGAASNKARKLCAQYQNNMTCVFKVQVGEEFSTDDLKKWREDENRLVFSLK